MVKPDPAAPFPALRRVSLVEQVAETIRANIRTGVWHEMLPAERTLCEEWQISRRTLNAALVRLRRDGLIRTQPRKGHAVTRSDPVQLPLSGVRTIGWLIESGPGDDYLAAPFLSAVEHALNARGYGLRMHSRPPRGFPERYLSHYVATHRVGTAYWALSALSAASQRWFMDAGVPALILGSPHPGVTLPYIDLDYRAVCRHAVSELRRHGHRRIACVSRKPDLAGTLRSRQGYHDSMEDGETCVIEHNGTAADIARKLKRAFTETPPTAILITFGAHALTVLCWLLQTGRRVPEDVSCICPGGDAFLHECVPELARYEVDWPRYGARCARKLITLASGRRTRAASLVADVTFRPGRSIGPCRES